MQKKDGIDKDREENVADEKNKITWEKKSTNE